MTQPSREPPTALLVVQLLFVLASMALSTLMTLPVLWRWFERGLAPDLLTAWVVAALIAQPLLMWVLSDRLRHKRESYSPTERALVIPGLILGCAAAVPTLALLGLPFGIGVVFVTAAAVGIAQTPYVCRRLGWLAPRMPDGE